MNFRASLAFALLSIVGATSFGPARVEAVDYALVDTINTTQAVNPVTQGIATDYDFAVPLQNGRAIAQEFYTFSPIGGYPQSGYTHYDLRNVSVNMFVSTAGSGTLELSLYSNSTTPGANLPNQKVATLKSFSIATDIGSASNTVLSTGWIDVPTTPNTKYWIVASVTGSGAVTFNVTGTSSTNYTTADANATNFSSPNAATFSPYTADFTGGAWLPTGGGGKQRGDVSPLRLIVTIPEPSTYAFAAISVVSLAAVARRRVKA